MPKQTRLCQDCNKTIKYIKMEDPPYADFLNCSDDPPYVSYLRCSTCSKTDLNVVQFCMDCSKDFCLACAAEHTSKPEYTSHHIWKKGSANPTAGNYQDFRFAKYVNQPDGLPPNFPVFKETADGYVEMGPPAPSACQAPKGPPPDDPEQPTYANLPHGCSTHDNASLGRPTYVNSPLGRSRPGSKTAVLRQSFKFSIRTDFDTQHATPARMTLSRNENHVILCDTGNKFIKKFDRKGGFEFMVLDYVSIEAAEPSSITCLANGNILVGYWNANGLLREINTNNTGYRQDIRTPAKELPFAAQNSKGKLIIADHKTSSLYMCEQNGRPLSQFGTTGLKVIKPINVHVDKRDWVYVSLLGKAVNVYDNQLNFKFQYKGHESFTPYGMTTDEDCNMLIADRDNDCVHLVSKDGQFMKYILSSEDGLNKPRDVVLTKDNQLLVACTDGYIHVYNYHMCEEI